MCKTTHQKRLKAVSKWIKSSCPDVMELKMGCRCRQYGDKMYEDCGLTMGSAPCDWTYCCSLNNKEHNADKILGSPIGIAEVLRAYRATNGILSKMLLVNDNGYFVEGLTKEGQKRIQWNLTKNLEDQSKECIEFLYSFTPDSYAE